MGDSLYGTPMNLRAEFVATSFILAGVIRNDRNRTNTQKQASKQTNKQQQTLDDISTPCCLSAWCG